MDCKTAHQLLAFLRFQPRELEPTDAGAVEDHLADCPECAALMQIERREDEVLGQAMREVPIAGDFRNRLLARLGRERRRWHLRAASQLASAAALLAVAWFGYGYWAHSNRPEIKLERLVDGVLSVRGEPPDQIEQWFRDQYGIRTVLPRGFNYAWLVSRARVDFQGRPVPQLLFLRSESYAEVLVLSTDQFKLSAPASAGSGGINVDLIPCPTDPHIVYLIYYNGGSLNWLILEGQPGAT